LKSIPTSLFRFKRTINQVNHFVKPCAVFLTLGISAAHLRGHPQTKAIAYASDLFGKEGMAFLHSPCVPEN
jgi:hypothetical protein